MIVAVALELASVVIAPRTKQSIFKPVHPFFHRFQGVGEERSVHDIGLHDAGQCGSKCGQLRMANGADKGLKLGLDLEGA